VESWSTSNVHGLCGFRGEYEGMGEGGVESFLHILNIVVKVLAGGGLVAIVTDHFR
jgi:hypothetical protein